MMRNSNNWSLTGVYTLERANGLHGACPRGAQIGKKCHNVKIAGTTGTSPVEAINK